MFQGKGKLTRADGAVYEGDFVGGMRQGHGTLMLASGDSYSGTWVGGCEHVSGTFIRPREYEYSGGVDAGAFHGVGTLKTASGHVYEGSFADGEKNGSGVLDGQDGSRYACAVRTLHFPCGAACCGFDLCYNCIWNFGLSWATSDACTSVCVTMSRPRAGTWATSRTARYTAPASCWTPPRRGGRARSFAGCCMGRVRPGSRTPARVGWKSRVFAGSMREYGGSKYRGSFSAGTFEGPGTLTNSVGLVIIGDFSTGVIVRGSAR